jgi:hypothetical protein
MGAKQGRYGSRDRSRSALSQRSAGTDGQRSEFSIALIPVTKLLLKRHSLDYPKATAPARGRAEAVIGACADISHGETHGKASLCRRRFDRAKRRCGGCVVDTAPTTSSATTAISTGRRRPTSSPTAPTGAQSDRGASTSSLMRLFDFNLQASLSERRRCWRCKPAAQAADRNCQDPLSARPITERRAGGSVDQLRTQGVKAPPLCPREVHATGPTRRAIR